MDENASLPPAPVPPGLFGTRTPSTVAFLVAVLLFLLPFVEIKCNNMALASVSGLQLATGFKLKPAGGGMLNDLKSDGVEESATGRRGANAFAVAALLLGVLGTGLAFTSSRTTLYIALGAAAASAASLVALFVDLKRKSPGKIPTGSSGNSGGGMDDFGNSLGGSLGISIDFTPWFYVSVAAFIAAAYFCYRRIQAVKTA